jgi:hypothetical protein
MLAWLPNSRSYHLRNATGDNTIPAISFMIILVGSTLFLSNIPVSDAQVSNTCLNQTLYNDGITANDWEAGYPPQNVLDSNLNTIWHTYGVGAWIYKNLGSIETVCSVDIAWYKGNFRQYNFVISYWTGNDWAAIFSGLSSGSTIYPEKYNIPDVNTRYLKITVRGNNDNNYAGISEINVNDYDASVTASFPVDKFGIRKIYSTKTGGQQWFMNMISPTSDTSRTNPPSMTKNTDGSWKVTSTQVRYGVYPSSGYDPGKITTLNHASLAKKGYMQSPNDWKNFEITGYVKVISGQSGENFAWYGRGGRHTGDGYLEGCEGSSYKGDLYYDGRTRFAKEQWHVSYVFTSHKQPMGSIEGKWVGFKTIMWNTIQHGNTWVKMQIWLDKNNNNNWVKVDERIDSGGWGNSGGECGGVPGQRITWGGPIATFRWDGATNVHIKNFSVREIQPPSS